MPSLMPKLFDDTRRSRQRIWLVLALVSIAAACKGERVIKDTDRELFKTPEELTRAREMNIAKWASDYVRRTGHLPAKVNDVRPAPEQPDPKDDPLHDAWGRSIEIVAAGAGFVVRSWGADAIANNADDIEYRVAQASGER